VPNRRIYAESQEGGAAHHFARGGMLVLRLLRQRLPYKGGVPVQLAASVEAALEE